MSPDGASEPENPGGTAIRTSGVVKRFGTGDTATMALKGVDFEASFGEIMMIVGPSGCGKTTLLSAICGTLSVDEGEVEVFGERIDSMRASKVTEFRRRNIGFIFQQFNLVPMLNAKENVSVPLLLAGWGHVKAEAKAAEMLDTVGLGDRTKHRPSQLSGGQQQRVAIARALVHEPRLVISDEPTAALDAVSGQKVLELMKAIAAKPDRCVVVVTHDNRIFHFADRVAEMDDGKVVSVSDAATAMAAHNAQGAH